MADARAVRPRALVTRRVAERAIELLSAACETEVWDGPGPLPRPRLIAGVRDLEALLCLLTERVDEELLAAAPRLRVVSNLAVGLDNVDVAACTRRGIAVGHTPGVLTEATADLTWALLLAAARRLPEAFGAVREGRWRTWEPLGFLGGDVHGATLGILGMGRIGEAVARRAEGFSMRVLYHNRRPRPAGEARVAARHVSLDRLLADSDFLSVHTPLTEGTRGMIGSAELARMKSTAVLINTARGGIVDQEALAQALRRRTIAAAALDVTEPEPLPAGHPLLAAPDCLIVPHIGSATRAARERMAILAAENLLAGLAGRPLPAWANPEVCPMG